jgi:hypothetical protein
MPSKLEFLIHLYPFLKSKETERERDKKMNPKIFYGAFLFALLATCINGRSLSSESNVDVVDNNSSDKGPTLIQILQNILDDPEYLAL